MASPGKSAPDTRRSRAGRRLSLAAASLAASLALAEGLLRVAWQNPYRAEAPDLVLELRMQHAGRALPIDRSALWPDAPPVALRTDERGYILPSRRFERPDATLAFLGGSTVECAVLPEDRRFPALVSSILEARGLRVNSLNAGLSGNTTHDALNLLVNRVAEDRPEVVVLMEATNDAGLLAVEGSYRSRSGAPATLADAARWLLQSTSARLALAGLARVAATSRVAEATEPPRARAPVSVEPYAARLRAFVRVARAFSIQPVLMTQPLARFRSELTPAWARAADQETFNDAVRRVAQEEGVVLFDLARHVEERVPERDRPMEVFYDGMHVTERGSQIYAEYIAERLLETVLRRTAPAARDAPAGG